MSQFLMNPFSWFFGCIVWLRNWLYDQNLLKSYRASVPVVSVGNIAVGGTGKTPWVIELAHRLNRANSSKLNIGIVARGYRGTNRGVLSVDQKTPASQCGDEPLIFASRKFGPVYVSHSKTKGVMSLCERENAHIVIVDDGFQHRRLRRDFDIVIVDVTTGSKDYSLLPKGWFREKLSSLKRADLVILNKWSQASTANQEFWRKSVLQQIDANKVVGASYLSQKPVPFLPNQKEFNSQEKYICIAALGNPSSFINTCTRAFSKKPEKSFLQRDHSDWPEKNRAEIIQWARDQGIYQVVTTEKDAVKINAWESDSSIGHSLNGEALEKVELWVLPINLSIDFGEEILEQYLEDMVKVL